MFVNLIYKINDRYNKLSIEFEPKYIKKVPGLKKKEK